MFSWYQRITAKQTHLWIGCDGFCWKSRAFCHSHLYLRTILKIQLWTENDVPGCVAYAIKIPELCTIIANLLFAARRNARANIKSLFSISPLFSLRFSHFLSSSGLWFHLHHFTRARCMTKVCCLDTWHSIFHQIKWIVSCHGNCWTPISPRTLSRRYPLKSASLNSSFS